jgi:glycosyltransferase involved in cell wall biosynthesis
MVIGDDGSDDATLGMIEEFRASSPFPVIVRRNPVRLGFAENFLHTAKACDAEVLALCDQDDVWHPQKLARMLGCFDDPLVTVAIHDAEVVDSELTPLGWHHPSFRESQVREIGAIDPWYGPPGFAMLVRRSLVTALDFSDRPQDHMADPGQTKPHDAWLYLVGSAVGRVALVSETLARYRQHNLNVSGSTRQSLRDRVRRSRAVTGPDYRYRAALAREYARRLMRDARDVPEFGWPDRLVAASMRWLGVADRLEQRAVLHNRGLPVVSRAAVLMLIAVHGGYRSKWLGGLGARSFGKDLMSLGECVGLARFRWPRRADHQT